jgi:hypothetical protein
VALAEPGLKNLLIFTALLPGSGIVATRHCQTVFIGPNGLDLGK